MDISIWVCSAELCRAADIRPSFWTVRSCQYLLATGRWEAWGAWLQTQAMDVSVSYVLPQTWRQSCCLASWPGLLLALSACFTEFLLSSPSWQNCKQSQVLVKDSWLDWWKVCHTTLVAPAWASCSYMQTATKYIPSIKENYPNTEQKEHFHGSSAWHGIWSHHWFVATHSIVRFFNMSSGNHTACCYKVKERNNKKGSVAFLINWQK